MPIPINMLDDQLQVLSVQQIEDKFIFVKIINQYFDY